MIRVNACSLGLRFTARLPTHAMTPPGHWELFKMAGEVIAEIAVTNGVLPEYHPVQMGALARCCIVSICSVLWCGNQK